LNRRPADRLPVRAARGLDHRLRGRSARPPPAAWAIAHNMLFAPGGLSVIACSAIRQSAEAVRRVREILIGVGAELRTDNVYALELKSGSRVLALPANDDSIRGLTVDGWIPLRGARRMGYHWSIGRYCGSGTRLDMRTCEGCTRSPTLDPKNHWGRHGNFGSAVGVPPSSSKRSVRRGNQLHWCAKYFGLSN
jgi:hypothetical protein